MQGARFKVSTARARVIICVFYVQHCTVLTAELDGNGDLFTGSAEGNRLMNKRQFYHRVLSGVRVDAQT